MSQIGAPDEGGIAGGTSTTPLAGDDIGPDAVGNTGVTSSTGEASGTSDSQDFFGCLRSRNKSKQKEDRHPEESGATQARIPDIVTDDSYRMDHRRRGKALIINQERFKYHLAMRGLSDRKGTEVDASAMRDVLHKFGFEVIVYTDANRYLMRSLFKQLSEEDHSDADCIACVILSHGEEGVVYGTDGTIEITELADYLKGDRCPSLIGKPKLFFIQACRGQQTDEGVKVNVSEVKGQDEVDALRDSSDIIRLPIEADFLFSYSTVPGYYSWRNFSQGSWFVQVLSDQLSQNGDKMELLKLLTITNRLVAQKFESNNDDPYFHRKKQVPCITSMLTKDIFLTKRPIQKYRPGRPSN